MLTVVCINVTNYLGRGHEYVDKLASMCEHYLPPHRFLCLTDAPDGYSPRVVPIEIHPNVPGFWVKVGMFQPGLFAGKMLYLDLDVVISGSLFGLLKLLDQSPGLWALDDWEFPLTKIRSADTYPEGVTVAEVLENVGPALGTCNSSVMLWEGDVGSDISTKFSSDAIKGLYGDQNWITVAMGDRLKIIPQGWARSYKLGGSGPILVFHGDPKPHEVTDPFVAQHWR